MSTLFPSLKSKEEGSFFYADTANKASSHEVGFHHRSIGDIWITKADILRLKGGRSYPSKVWTDLPRGSRSSGLGTK
jgi:hypothetical protein